jgi:hypothetical protein
MAMNEQTLWWQVRERLAAQAWSCDDTTWEVPAVGGTVGSLLTAYAGEGLSARLDVARSLQQLSDERAEGTPDLADTVVDAWLTLRRIDSALGRPPIDLRSEVALFVGARLLDDLTNTLRSSDRSATVTITGPGFVSSIEIGAQPDVAAATMSWPTFARVAAGTLAIADSEMDLTGEDAAIDEFLDALTEIRRT